MAAPRQVDMSVYIKRLEAMPELQAGMPGGFSGYSIAVKWVTLANDWCLLNSPECYRPMFWSAGRLMQKPKKATKASPGTQYKPWSAKALKEGLTALKASVEWPTCRTATASNERL